MPFASNVSVLTASAFPNPVPGQIPDIKLDVQWMLPASKNGGGLPANTYWWGYYDGEFDPLKNGYTWDWVNGLPHGSASTILSSTESGKTYTCVLHADPSDWIGIVSYQTIQLP